MPETPHLLPPNATKLERALAIVMHRRIDAIPVPIRDLWDADKCPAHLLGWLAWSLSVDVWEADWPEATQREVIRQAFNVHVHKGTVGAVKRALAALDIGAEITEWWQDGSPRGTFKIDAFADQIFSGGGAIDARLLAMVTAVVERSKRASQHFSLRIGERFMARQFLRAGTRMKFVHRIDDMAPQPRTYGGVAVAQLRSTLRVTATHRHTHDIQTRAA